MTQNHLLTTAYLFTHSLRKNLLYSVFGYMYHCKHSPTCGQYFLQQVESKGALTGICIGFWRAIRCW